MWKKHVYSLHIFHPESIRKLTILHSLLPSLCSHQWKKHLIFCVLCVAASNPQKGPRTWWTIYWSQDAIAAAAPEAFAEAVWKSFHPNKCTVRNTKHVFPGLSKDLFLSETSLYQTMVEPHWNLKLKKDEQIEGDMTPFIKPHHVS